MNTFNINGGMTIYEAMQLKNTLQAEITQSIQLVVDLASVSEIDTTGLQLLLALNRETSVRLINHSHCIKQLAELLQVQEALGMQP